MFEKYSQEIHRMLESLMMVIARKRCPNRREDTISVIGHKRAKHAA